MNRYATEPSHTHDSPQRTALLLVNLGTPEAPTAAAVRRYLGQFLWDPRVVEIPRPLWWLILKGIILNIRPRKSAAKYAKIWTSRGSPLKVFTERQSKLLQGLLGERGLGELRVAYAMRYGEPAIGATLDLLKSTGVTRILIVPLYPQYAASTTASVMDEVADWLKRTRNQPEIRTIRSYCDAPAYINALAESIRGDWRNHPPGDSFRLVMSFHGLPKRSLDLGDPYFCECHKTGRLLAEALGLPPDRYLITFQSRFGKAEWLQPYTQPTLEKLAREGIQRVDVVCPGFVADCLETLEEIALECKAAFLAEGGSEFNYLPCLNDRPDGIAALADIIQPHLSGWPPVVPADPQTSERARAHGSAR